ncbi:universal stress protein [Nitrospira sp. BLG_2]|uniref:universal stress protein n=1 Tax=Nitrospira sp. BLG_2 TaxID=3397507 RepID=UPI003B9DA045
MRLLVAVDESENARRAVQYVGSLLHRTPNVMVTLFHVLKPMPRVLLEHGGSENPDIEEALGTRLRRDQQAWVKQEIEAECSLLERACETLVRAGFDKNLVTLKFGHEDDIAKTIVEEATIGRYETIVVGRTGASGITRIFGGGITDRLLRDARGFALWIIE